MRYIVFCEVCVGAAPLAECRDKGSAEALVRRHHGLHGHHATVTQVFDTPHEGLLT